MRVIRKATEKVPFISLSVKKKMSRRLGGIFLSGEKDVVEKRKGDIAPGMSPFWGGVQSLSLGRSWLRIVLVSLGTSLLGERGHQDEKTVRTVANEPEFRHGGGLFTAGAGVHGFV